MAKRYTLVGPNAGKTILLGPYQFNNGEYIFEGSDNDSLLLERVMIPFYSAYPDSQLESARRAFDDRAAASPRVKAQIVSEAADVAGDKAEELRQAQAQASTLQTDLDKALAELSQLKAASASTPTPTPTPAPATPAPEPTSAPAPDPKAFLVEVLKQLDPANDDHWTALGLPDVKAVETLAGKPVSRKEIDEAAKGFNREAAKKAADPLA